MQTRGSINKSPIKLSMQQKINNMMICLRMGKTYTGKTPPGDFKVTTPKFHNYHNNRLQVKKS